MMVPLESADEQSKVLLDCAQNHHSADVMVIDELAVYSTQEAQSLLMLKQRGTRLIAGAHGNLRKLVQDTIPVTSEGVLISAGGSNVPLCSRLIGSATPIFDAIVELQPSNRHEWRVVVNTGQAVQQVLNGNSFLAQQRTRDPDTGGVLLDAIRM